MEKGLSARGQLPLTRGLTSWPRIVGTSTVSAAEEHLEHRQLDVAAEAQEQFQEKGMVKTARKFPSTQMKRDRETLPGRGRS